MKYFTLAFKRWNDVEGVSTRTEYWMFILYYAIGFIVLDVIGMVLDNVLGTEWILGTLIGLLLLATILPGISIGIRRLHDAGFSGWWLLLNFIPYIGWIILLFFICRKTKTVGNKYAPTTIPAAPVTPVA